MIRKGIGLALGLVLATAMSAAAAIPAPPVNQLIGIPDTTFNNMTEATCRTCHNQTPPAGVPVDPTYLPDRHHLVVGTPIPAITDVRSDLRDSNGDGVADTTYDCMNCHRMTFNPVTRTTTIGTFRDCMYCHQQTAASNGTVHHRTQFAQDGECAECHGSLVDAGIINDQIVANWIPTYKPSLVTPWPSKKPNGGTPLNVFREPSGSCKYCHSNRTGVEGNPVQEPAGAFGTLNIVTNSETHHTTGLQTADKCTWCHNAGGNPTADGFSIRTCENCHGVPSLHNIQADITPATAIVPGREPAGYGHIGQNSDCQGCHGHNGVIMYEEVASMTIPNLQTLSASSVVAGANVTLKGSGLINTAMGMTFKSDVVLTDDAGFQTPLVPVSVTADAIVVKIPATMPNANYKIQARKVYTDPVTGVSYPESAALSNPLNLSVTPLVAISSKSTASSKTGITVTINGNNFSSNFVAGATSVTGIDSKGRTVNGTVSSWTNTKVVAKFSTTPRTVTVNALFGSATK